VGSGEQQPKVVAPPDRGYFPRGHGHPRAFLASRGKDHFKPPLYEGRPKKGKQVSETPEAKPLAFRLMQQDPKGLSTSLRSKPGLVKLEPNLFHGGYIRPKTQMWKRVEAKSQRRGIYFRAPLPFKGVKLLYQLSHALHALHLLSEKVVKHGYGLKDAVTLYHQTRRFFTRSVSFTPGSIVDARLKGCAINLRSAKVKHSLAVRGL